MTFKTCLAALAFGVMPLAALAQGVTPPAPTPAQSEARQKVRAACAADIQKFCADVERGKNGGMRACLEKNDQQLSAGCKTARAERAAARGN